MDEADHAQVFTEAFTERSIAAVRSLLSGPPPVITDGVHFCGSCGDTIEPARIAAIPGVGLCYSCQVDMEDIHGRG